MEGLQRVINAAPRAAILIDEAYFEFSGITVLGCIGQYPNLFVSRTFSKVYGMAAMRCGCLFSRAENVRWLRKAQSPYSVNMLAAIAASAAVQDREYVANYVSEVLAARDLACEGLRRLGITFYPSQANFVLFQAGERAIAIRDALRERGVLVRDRSYEIPGCARVTIGTRPQIERFLKELEKLWTRSSCRRSSGSPDKESRANRSRIIRTRAGGTTTGLYRKKSRPIWESKWTTTPWSRSLTKYFSGPMETASSGVKNGFLNRGFWSG
jgi:histidinol-phosphate/aromatic aminotransferase/cobyric acid decarboxylase-like protein